MKWATRTHSWIWLLITHTHFWLHGIFTILQWTTFLPWSFISFGQWFESRERAKKMATKKGFFISMKFIQTQKFSMQKTWNFVSQKNRIRLLLYYYQWCAVLCFEFYFIFLFDREKGKSSWKFIENFQLIHSELPLKWVLHFIAFRLINLIGYESHCQHIQVSFSAKILCCLSKWKRYILAKS